MDSSDTTVAAALPLPNEAASPEALAVLQVLARQPDGATFYELREATGLGTNALRSTIVGLSRRRRLRAHDGEKSTIGTKYFTTQHFQHFQREHGARA